MSLTANFIICRFWLYLEHGTRSVENFYNRNGTHIGQGERPLPWHSSHSCNCWWNSLQWRQVLSSHSGELPNCTIDHADWLTTPPRLRTAAWLVTVSQQYSEPLQLLTAPLWVALSIGQPLSQLWLSSLWGCLHTCCNTVSQARISLAQRPTVLPFLLGVSIYSGFRTPESFWMISIQQYTNILGGGGGQYKVSILY